MPADRTHPSIGGLPLVLGGNVFGWTIDRDRSFAVLDAFYEGGGRMIDSAEGYSAWVPGNKGGESEAIIGEWMESRGVRADMRIATKTGMGGGERVLGPERVARALDGSLERLRTDYIDLYYAHRDDLSTPLAEVAEAFGSTVASGKAREIGASNYTADRLEKVITAAERTGTVSFTVLQPLYNLVEREVYEGALQSVCVRRGIAVLPFYGLASGFLTGKYASSADWEGSVRSHGLEKAAAGGGWGVLERVRRVAKEIGVEPAQVALAWLRKRPGIAAPVASATSPNQVAQILASARIDLSDECLAMLEPD
jgi:aryl-alcohol dehydrogenase-like predicted oxidoreductase